MAAAAVFVLAALSLIALAVPVSVFAVGVGLVAVGGMFAHNGREKMSQWPRVSLKKQRVGRLHHLW